MRFRIEQIFLTDPTGKVVGGIAPQFHLLDAASADDALRAFAHTDNGEIIGDILKLPGFQAIATVRNGARVYTLQVSPISDHIRRNEFRPGDRDSGRK